MDRVINKKSPDFNGHIGHSIASSVGGCDFIGETSYCGTKRYWWDCSSTGDTFITIECDAKSLSTALDRVRVGWEGA